MAKCNSTRRNCSADQLFAAVADPVCSNQYVGLDALAGEQIFFDQTFNDLINNFGIAIDYYINMFDLSNADSLYGEHPTAVFYGPIPVKMYIEIDNEAVTLQSFGFDSADDFTGYVHIQTFEDTLSARDVFVQTASGDILPINEYVATFEDQDEDEGFVTHNGFEFAPETMIDRDVFVNSTINTLITECEDLRMIPEILKLKNNNGDYSILNKFIETNYKLEPKSGDLIDVVQLGCDRPGGRCSKIFEITERMDQDLAGGLNPLLGHYIWRMRAKRYESSFEPGAPQECANDQVYENATNGVVETNITGEEEELKREIMSSDDMSAFTSEDAESTVLTETSNTDEALHPKSYDWDVDKASKDIYDQDKNDTDIYGGYY